MKTKLLSLLVISALALFAACKKGKNGSPDEPYFYRPTSLYGNLWSAQPHVDGVDNLLGFQADSSFIKSINNYPPQPRSTNWVTGKYRIKGDSVSFTITERKTSVDNGPVTTTTVNEKLYDKATYKIQGYELIINYTDYSSGASVVATAKFTYMPPAL